MFADDVGAMINSKEQMQNYTTIFNNVCKDFGMDISDGKTEVMVQRSRLSSKKGESAEIKLMNSDNEEVTLKVVSEHNT